MSCPFCNSLAISERIFYEDPSWVALLAAPPYTKGHTILAAKTKHNNVCPTGFGLEVIGGLDIAVSKVCETLKKKYGAKDVLIASLRGKIKHNHWHLIPLHEDDENNWRSLSGHNSGHLFEFLGYLEQKGVECAKKEREDKRINEEDQLAFHKKILKPEVVLLKGLIDETS
jgi:diadenosine tetraphosphate (Ap4A) HIT family hydrolase